MLLRVRTETGLLGIPSWLDLRIELDILRGRAPPACTLWVCYVPINGHSSGDISIIQLLPKSPPRLFVTTKTHSAWHSQVASVILSRMGACTYLEREATTTLNYYQEGFSHEGQ